MDVRDVVMPDAELADAAQALQRSDQAVRARPRRGSTEPIQLGLSLPFGGDEERQEVVALLGRGDAFELFPQPDCRSFAHP